MDEHFSKLGRYISILDRLMKMYYDHGLSDYETGWGQQFYIEFLYDNPGASAQDMVNSICVDKATLTKVMKKLSEIGYITAVADEKDRRKKHLYLTDKAIPSAQKIKEIHNSFYKDLCADISEQEISLTEQTLKHMMENINQKVWHRMEV